MQSLNIYMGYSAAPNMLYFSLKVAALHSCADGLAIVLKAA